MNASRDKKPEIRGKIFHFDKLFQSLKEAVASGLDLGQMVEGDWF